MEVTRVMRVEPSLVENVLQSGVSGAVRIRASDLPAGGIRFVDIRKSYMATEGKPVPLIELLLASEGWEPWADEATQKRKRWKAPLWTPLFERVE
jgi:hypothetical protein